jgi:hypothetical protein
LKKNATHEKKREAVLTTIMSLRHITDAPIIQFANDVINSGDSERLRPHEHATASHRIDTSAKTRLQWC